MMYRVYEIDDKGMLNWVDYTSYSSEKAASDALLKYDKEGMYVWGKTVTILKVWDF